jgi:hypothetical protein
VTENCPRHARARLAVAALLVLLAFSLAPAWGSKPPEEETVKVTMRPLSMSEVTDILDKFPELDPYHVFDLRRDTSSLKYQFSFKEVTSAPMERVLPRVRFYQGLEQRGSGADIPYVIAMVASKRYWVPASFNELLFDNGMEVTDKNIIGLAKALLVATAGSDHYPYPDITFLGATTTKLQAWATDAAQLKVMIGGKEEEWHFSVLRNQFDGISRTNERGLIKDYMLNEVRSAPKR